MKKIIALLMTVLLLFSTTCGESWATPTDLAPVIEETDEILEDTSDEVLEEELIIEESEEELSIDELYPNHHIEIRIIQHPQVLGDEVILGFELIDYPPGYITAIEWQYSEDNIEWFPIEGETAETFKFIITKDNYKLWYRVMVSYHFDLNI